MKKARTASVDRVDEALDTALSKDRQVRVPLDGGRLHLDRPLPFLCVSAAQDEASRFVEAESAHLTSTNPDELRPVALRVAKRLADRFGAFLLIEVAIGSRDLEADSPRDVSELLPGFRLIVPPGSKIHSVHDSAEQELARLKFSRGRAWTRREVWASGASSFEPVFAGARMAKGVEWLRIEIFPVHRDPETDQPFPALERRLRRAFTRCLRRFLFDFVRSSTSDAPLHQHMLGRRVLARHAHRVDEALAGIASRFSLLRLVTPSNQLAALREFRRGGFRAAPTFLYHPLNVDPVALKQALWNVPVLDVEDPALTHLFRETQDDLDRQLSLLLDRGTPRFLWESLQAFGEPTQRTVDSARQILAGTTRRHREGGERTALSAEQFAAAARDAVRSDPSGPWQGAELPPIAVVSGIGESLMVSHGRLLIGERKRIPKGRVDALIAHEVFTHMLTHHNGCRQSLKLLSTGLAGYEALQEGLAVFAEFLVGGLTRARLRLLAARVIAVDAMVKGAGFVETFHLLRGELGFALREAFAVTIRVHRGGGFTKDALYLQGLNQVLDHVAGGGELGPLHVGKFAMHHLPLIRELSWRGVLSEPAWRPPHLAGPDLEAKLAVAAGARSPLDLLK